MRDGGYLENPKREMICIEDFIICLSRHFDIRESFGSCNRYVSAMKLAKVDSSTGCFF